MIRHSLTVMIALWLLSGVGVQGASDDAKDKAIKDELKRIEGTWVL